MQRKRGSYYGKYYISGRNCITEFETFFLGCRTIVQNKKQFIAAICLAGVWILLTLFSMLGVSSVVVRFGSWLTFAQGGLKGGTIGLIGGILGKGMFATLIVSLLSGNMKGMQNGAIRLISALKKESIGMILTGAGAALIGYNFMAGVSCPIQSMAGICGCCAFRIVDDICNGTCCKSMGWVSIHE